MEILLLTPHKSVDFGGHQISKQYKFCQNYFKTRDFKVCINLLLIKLNLRNQVEPKLKQWLEINETRISEYSYLMSGNI